MSARTKIIAHVTWLCATIVLVCFLTGWAGEALGAFDPKPDPFPLVFRGLFRFAFAGFIAVLSLGTQAWTLRRFRPF
jgi:hypothetical protein